MSSVHRFQEGILIAVAIILSLSFISGCDDKPTKPVAAKDYVVYFGDSGNDTMLYGYHPATGLVDSIVLPRQLIPTLIFDISSDGRLLYLPTANSIMVFDLINRTVVSEHPIELGGEVAVSPDGRHLALMRGSGPVKKFFIFSLADFSVVYLDTIYTGNGVFSDDGNEFYCYAEDSDGWMYVYIVDLANSFRVTRKYFSGAVIHMLPNMDMSRWFIMMRISDDISQFLVYDVARDSIMFARLLIPGAGEIELTPDNRFVVITQPGTMFNEVPDVDYFTIYSVERNAIDQLVTPWEYPNPLFDEIGQIELTPDGRWLVGLPGYITGELFAYDMTSRTFERFTLVNRSMWAYPMRCQALP